MTGHDSVDANQPASGKDRLALIVGWLVVGIPAVWGISQVVAKSLALFK